MKGSNPRQDKRSSLTSGPKLGVSSDYKPHSHIPSQKKQTEPLSWAAVCCGGVQTYFGDDERLAVLQPSLQREAPRSAAAQLDLDVVERHELLHRLHSVPFLPHPPDPLFSVFSR